MTGLLAISLHLWTSTLSINTEFYEHNTVGQLSCTQTYRKTGVCKSVKYDIKRFSCIVKKNDLEPMTVDENKILTFKKVSMCVPVCDGSCDDPTKASSVGLCGQNRKHGLSNKPDVFQPNLLQLATGASREVDLFKDNAYTNISLHQACGEGNLCMVQFILSQSPADINTRDKLGRTPVMVAVMNNQVEVFDFLVSQNCDLMLVDNNHGSVLHVACQAGNADIVEKLVVNHACHMEGRDRTGMTPVLVSALFGQTDVVGLLVEKGCNVRTVDDNMNNILHVSCRGGHVDMVKYAISKLHFDIESKGQGTWTPVMLATCKGHLMVVKYLVHKGCKLTVIDKAYRNVLHVACYYGHLNIVKYILSQTDTLTERRQKWTGFTPVMVAAGRGQKSAFMYLVKYGCRLELTDKSKNSILHVACMGGNVDIVKYIVKNHIFGIERRGENRWTPVLRAAYNGHMSIFMFLMSQQCNVNVRDKDHNNLLHVACMGGHVNIVKYIVEKLNFEIERSGRSGWTPVMIAAFRGHVSVVKYLQEKGCNMANVDKKGRDVLELSCGHGDMVKYLMTLKAWSKTC